MHNLARESREYRPAYAPASDRDDIEQPELLSVDERAQVTSFIAANPRTSRAAGLVRLWQAYRALYALASSLRMELAEERAKLAALTPPILEAACPSN